MTTPVDITTLTFPQLRLRPADAGRLRGYFAKAFGDQSILFHNHGPDDKFRYAYSQIQYKVLRGAPTVVGVAEGAALVMKAFVDIEELNLDGQRVRINDKELKVDRIEAGVINELREYRLATPLFMFNQDNYTKFRGMADGDRPMFLNNLLRAHLVTALRGIGCEVIPERPLMVSPRLEIKMVNTKNQRMQMYVGGFTTNAAIPTGIGIGKSISKGFGTIIPA